jgi:hypothetical protein
MTSSPRVLTAAAITLVFASAVSAQHSAMRAGMKTLAVRDIV